MKSQTIFTKKEEKAFKQINSAKEKASLKTRILSKYSKGVLNKFFRRKRLCLILVLILYIVLFCGTG